MDKCQNIKPSLKTNKPFNYEPFLTNYIHNPITQIKI